MCSFLFSFFFFKQKTAYEMRISDWIQTCALPIFQGVQYFNLLRGLRKPVVMLQYEGAGHATNKDRPEDELDFARRRLEFFDHFLKGRPAPTWWAKGTP